MDLPAWHRIKELELKIAKWKGRAKSQELRVRTRELKAVVAIRHELIEVQKEIKRLKKITHCKDCQCSAPKRREYFKARYEGRKAVRQ